MLPKVRPPPPPHSLLHVRPSGWSLKKIDDGATTFDPEASKNIDAAGLIESYMAGRATHWQVLMHFIQSLGTRCLCLFLPVARWSCHKN